MLVEVFVSYREWKDDRGFLQKEWRNEARKLHRESGPAQISYYIDGSIRREKFYKDGSLNREDGPASIYYNLDGSINEELFYLDGYLHREDGPAAIRYYLDGSIEQESFCVSGALIGRDKEGFCALWEILSEEGRRAPNLLKYLAGFVNYSCSSYVKIKK